MSKPTTLARATVNSVALLICMIALAATGAAQQEAQRTPEQRRVSPVPTASPTPPPTAPTATDNYDLSITANVTARELLFEVVPNPTVEFPGRPRRDTVWEAERTNLPPQVQPGVTYRDIGIRLRITSVFADIERIVAEALGEIPVSDDATPPKLEPDAGGAPQTDSAQTATNDPPPRADNILPAKSPAQTSRASSVRATRARGRSSSNRNSAPPRQGRP